MYHRKHDHQRLLPGLSICDCCRLIFLLWEFCVILLTAVYILPDASIVQILGTCMREHITGGCLHYSCGLTHSRTGLSKFHQCSTRGAIQG